jgi:hypothetical protein
MGCDGLLKRFALFAVMRLLGVYDLRGQLSQSPQMKSRGVGGAAILAAHLHAAKQNSNGSVMPNRTIEVGYHIGTIIR